MKVIFLPFDGLNPYQAELARALAAIQVNVLPAPVHRWLALASLLWRFKGTRIIHLHWLSGFLIKSSVAKSVCWSTLFCLEALVVKLAGGKLVWTVHNLLEHERRHAKIELFFLKRLVPMLDHIFVHSAYARETVMCRLRLHDSSKISIIPHGHYIDVYPNTVTREDAREILEIPPSAPVFLFFGQIREYKGLTDLLTAFRDPALREAILLVAGHPQSSRLAEDLRSMASGCTNIKLSLDFVPAEEVQLFMNAADHVVFPYRDIFTSGSVLLAMSFGRKLIVPNVPSLAEIIAGMDGRAFDPDDFEGLRSALLVALREDRYLGGERSLAYAVDCGWEKIADRTSQVYWQLQPDRRSPE